MLYGAIARESVGKLFLRGAIPGILVGVSLSDSSLPPFGEYLFPLSAITGLPVGRVAAVVAPCLVGMLIVLALIRIFPGLVTWPPNLLM